MHSILEDYAKDQRSSGKIDSKEYNEAVARIREYFSVMLGTWPLDKCETTVP